MSRRIAAILIAVTALTLTAAPAFAKPRVIAEKTALKHINEVYLAHGLVPGHAYQIEITASGRYAFAGWGSEFYTYVANRQLFSGNKSIKLVGNTTKYFTVHSPKGRVTSWALAVNVSLENGSGLTVRYLDLGRHK